MNKLFCATFSGVVSPRRLYEPTNLLFYARILAFRTIGLPTPVASKDTLMSQTLLFRRYQESDQKKTVIGLMGKPGHATNPLASRSRANASNTRKVLAASRVSSTGLWGLRRDVSIRKIIKPLMPPRTATELSYATPPANDFIWALPATFRRDLQRRWIEATNVTWSSCSKNMGIVFSTALSCLE
jgi:hypothetical protein